MLPKCITSIIIIPYRFDVVVQNDVRPTVLGLDRFYCLGLCGTARSFLFFNYSCDVYLSLLRIVPYVVV